MATSLINIDPNNRWVKLRNETRWEELEAFYNSKLDSNKIHPGASARMVIASLIIKYKIKISSEETINMLRENPYLQYFIGIEEYSSALPLTSRMLLAVKGTFNRDEWEEFKRIIIQDNLSSPSSAWSSFFLKPKNNDQGNSTSFPVSNRDYRNRRNKAKQKRKAKKRFKKIYTGLVWFVVIALVLGSIIAIVSQLDLRDRRNEGKPKKGTIKEL